MTDRIEIKAQLTATETGEITGERLKELLTYDPETGVFRWRVASSNRAPAGSIARNIDRATGYIRVNVDGRRYYAHRLAFLYMTGAFPPAEVDHINGDPSDNRWLNLRPATRSENERNKGIRRGNALGVKGVERLKSGNFQVRLSVNGKRMTFGTYGNLKDAAARRDEVANLLHGEFARSA